MSDLEATIGALGDLTNQIESEISHIIKGDSTHSNELTNRSSDQTFFKGLRVHQNTQEVQIPCFPLDQMFIKTCLHIPGGIMGIDSLHINKIFIDVGSESEIVRATSFDANDCTLDFMCKFNKMLSMNNITITNIGYDEQDRRCFVMLKYRLPIKNKTK